MKLTLPTILDLPAVRALYASGWSPAGLFEALVQRIDAADPAIFISRPPLADLQAAVAALIEQAPVLNSLPLWGMPLAVKDNIDVAGMPTTAACPAFTRIAETDAAVVARLRAAGAIVVGKTNLDQFATGLSGTRSPYGVPRSVFDAEYISGGSSSGSAVAVAAGLAAFALGTDTAGSGRVPAAFNNIVGIKPTPGLLSTSGVVPACRSLDCVSIFATTVADGAAVRRLAEGFDTNDPYSVAGHGSTLPDTALRIGVLKPADREFFDDCDTPHLYEAAIRRIEQLGHQAIEIDFAPFRETGALLYDGPWVAERLAAFERFGIALGELDSSVAAVVLQSGRYTAAQAFDGQHRLADLRREAAGQWAKADILLLPTAPATYRVEAMLADPLALNSRLGIYTNFFNLLGLAGIAVPAGFGSDGLPFGITLAAPAFHDDALVPLASAMHHAAASGTGIDRSAVVPPALSPLLEPDAVGDQLQLAVVGAHLEGMSLNHELRSLGATLVRACRTMPDYRLFLLDTTPPKPGLIREPDFIGPGIAIEIWALRSDVFGNFVAHIPAPLGIGQIALADGSSIPGFLCEYAGVTGAREITGFGGWRAFVAASAEALLLEE